MPTLTISERGETAGNDLTLVLNDMGLTWKVQLEIDRDMPRRASLAEGLRMLAEALLEDPGE